MVLEEDKVSGRITGKMYRLGAVLLLLGAGSGCDWPRHSATEPPRTSYRLDRFTLNSGEISRTIQGASVTPVFFQTTKVRPWLGRLFTPADYQSPVVAVLSSQFWKQGFHADPAALGRTLQVNGKDVIIVGVTPPGFDFPPGVDLWLPVASVSGKGTIDIWRIVSPNAADTALDRLLDTVIGPIARAGSKAGLSIQVTRIPVHDFAERFLRAVEQHNEPEAVVAENPIGQFAGIASRKEIRRYLMQLPFETFEAPSFLVTPARGFALAKSLVQPECKPEWTGLRPLGDELKGASLAALRAYLAGSAVAEDPDRLRTPRPDRGAAQGLQNPALCGYWGNERLAFVPLVTVFEKDRPTERGGAVYEPLFASMERLVVTLILRAGPSGWKMLGAATDPVSTGAFLARMRDFQKLLDGRLPPAATPSAATLLSPSGGTFPTPAAGAHFGDFRWRPSRSEEAVAEIVEFAYHDDARYFLRFRNKDEQAEEKISSGELWRTDEESKWRVWTIARSGAVSFSPDRTFRQ